MDDDNKETIMRDWEEKVNEYDEANKWQISVAKLKHLQNIMAKKKPAATGVNITPWEIDEEDNSEEETISERTLDAIIEAFQNGATPDWLILKGDKNSKAAAKAWIAAQKRIEARRIAAEKAKRKAELREQALSKLTDEEKAALGIKA